jgi:hypothetical protein
MGDQSADISRLSARDISHLRALGDLIRASPKRADRAQAQKVELDVAMRHRADEVTWTEIARYLGFSLWDADFGPAFIKVCVYFPYPTKIWVNGHEWAERQAIKAGIAFTELSNGFASCADPAALQQICSRSATGCSRAPSRYSPSGGCTACRCRSPAPTSGPGTGGRSRCARWRCRAPWCSTRHDQADGAVFRPPTTRRRVNARRLRPGWLTLPTAPSRR